MTPNERSVFEELKETASAALYQLGKALPIGVVLSFSQPFVRAANAAEAILDPLRTQAERERVESFAYSRRIPANIAYDSLIEAARAVIESTYDQPSDGPEVRQPPSQESLDKLETIVIPLVAGR